MRTNIFSYIPLAPSMHPWLEAYGRLKEANVQAGKPGKRFRLSPSSEPCLPGQRMVSNLSEPYYGDRELPMTLSDTLLLIVEHPCLLSPRENEATSLDLSRGRVTGHGSMHGPESQASLISPLTKGDQVQVVMGVYSIEG
jgi:hypothetical protein